MIDDPDDPGYRYPEPGERYWHVSRERWVITQTARDPLQDKHLRALGEVIVVFVDDDRQAIVKLYNLGKR